MIGCFAADGIRAPTIGVFSVSMIDSFSFPEFPSEESSLGVYLYLFIFTLSRVGFRLAARGRSQEDVIRFKLVSIIS